MYTVLMTSYVGFESLSVWCWVWYCPEGVNRRLPSGVKVNRRKKEVKVSLAYRLAFLTPKPVLRKDGGLGDASIGMTAGRGMEGAGEGERREEKDDLRLWLITLGGFIGRGSELGVPGAEGTGELIDADVTESAGSGARTPKSGGAGLLDEILRGGRSALA